MSAASMAILGVLGAAPMAGGLEGLGALPAAAEGAEGAVDKEKKEKKAPPKVGTGSGSGSAAPPAASKIPDTADGRQQKARDELDALRAAIVVEIDRIEEQVRASSAAAPAR